MFGNMLIDPKHDIDLQGALKAERVLTVIQNTVGTKTDRVDLDFILDATGNEMPRIIGPRVI